MIIIRIQGGLGNQLFQYALAASLKAKKNIDVILDVSFFNNQFGQKGATKRDFILDHFNVQNFERTIDKEILLGNTFVKKVKRFFERNFLPHYKNTYVIEKQSGFDNDVFRIKNNAYLDGYWQSYKYFENIENSLRMELSLKTQLSYESTCLLNDIKLQNTSISIHIRRGDYINKYSTFYYQITPDYYQNSIEFIKKQLNTDLIKIYVFSDDIEWCKENIKIEEHHQFVPNAKKEEFEDLILMSNCSHNIIANSTYSWWGAWLNLNPNKIVVCPKKWFNDSNLNFNQTIYPSSWNTL